MLLSVAFSLEVCMLICNVKCALQSYLLIIKLNVKTYLTFILTYKCSRQHIHMLGRGTEGLQLNLKCRTYLFAFWTYFCAHHTYSYTQQTMKGMKAYKSLTNPDDLRLFRPDRNMQRLSNSMHRLSCPGYDFDKVELIRCIAELVRVGTYQ